MAKRSTPEFRTWACSLCILVFSLHIGEVAAADDPAAVPSILPPIVLDSAAPTVLLTTIPGTTEIIFPDDDGFHLSDRVVDLLGQRAGVYTDSPAGEEVEARCTFAASILTTRLFYGTESR